MHLGNIKGEEEGKKGRRGGGERGGGEGGRRRKIIIIFGFTVNSQILYKTGSVAVQRKAYLCFSPFM